MRTLTETEFDAYQEYMINPTLNKAAPGEEGHVEDHNLIADSLTLLVPVPQVSAVKNGDNSWELDGDALTDEDMEGFLANPNSGHMIGVTPDDWQSVSSAPAGTEIHLYHVGLYGLMVELTVLKNRVDELEHAITNPE